MCQVDNKCFRIKTMNVYLSSFTQLTITHHCFHRAEETFEKLPGKLITKPSKSQGLSLLTLHIDCSFRRQSARRCCTRALYPSPFFQLRPAIPRPNAAFLPAPRPVSVWRAVLDAVWEGRLLRKARPACLHGSLAGRSRHS